MKAISFNKAIEALGYTIEKKSKGYNFRTTFATDKDGQLWYFHIEDLRDTHPMVFRRTAKDLKDYTGGMNRFDVEDQLEDLGYKIVEKRQKCDYNSL